MEDPLQHFDKLETRMRSEIVDVINMYNEYYNTKNNDTGHFLYNIDSFNKRSTNEKIAELIDEIQNINKDGISITQIDKGETFKEKGHWFILNFKDEPECFYSDSAVKLFLFIAQKDWSEKNWSLTEVDLE